ncbi:MAG: putative ABC transport system permease protein [Sulfitobacter sp.]
MVARLTNALPTGNLRIQTMTTSASNDLAYMATERPTGIIFGIGVFMGILVGLVIVYQVLSTEVADHLREYATFKAMDYGQPFLGSYLRKPSFLPGSVSYQASWCRSNSMQGSCRSPAGPLKWMTAARSLFFLAPLRHAAYQGPSRHAGSPMPNRQICSDVKRTDHNPKARSLSRDG